MVTHQQTNGANLTANAILAKVAKQITNMEDKQFLRRIVEIEDHPLYKIFTIIDESVDEIDNS